MVTNRLSRTYTCDLEVYDKRFTRPVNKEVEIYGGSKIRNAKRVVLSRHRFLKHLQCSRFRLPSPGLRGHPSGTFPTRQRGSGTGHRPLRNRSFSMVMPVHAGSHQPRKSPQPCPVPVTAFEDLHFFSGRDARPVVLHGHNNTVALPRGR